MSEYRLCPCCAGDVDDLDASMVESYLLGAQLAYDDANACARGRPAKSVIAALCPRHAKLAALCLAANERANAPPEPLEPH